MTIEPTAPALLNRAACGHGNCETFTTGAMCAVCGWECDPGDTGCVADRDHAAFDPAHEPLWHANG